MQLVFERGNSATPKGHALIYFRASNNRSRIWATYCIVPPIPLSLTKYLPAMMAAQIPLSEMNEVAAMPLPPMPEEVQSYEYLQQLAAFRDDDLCDAGALNPDDVTSLLGITSEAVQSYSALYEPHRRSMPAIALGGQAGLDEQVLDSDELIYSVMSDKDKLSEIAHFIGTARYALDGHDTQLLDETLTKIEKVGRFLPEKYRMPEVLAAIKQPGERGNKLAQLYLDRCFKLCNEEYNELDGIEQQIRAIKAEG